MRNYDIGDEVVVAARFSVASGAKDPTTVTCRITPPDGGTPVVVTPARTVTELPDGLPAAGTGVYYGTYLPTVSGIHKYEFLGTGAVKAAERGSFYVRVP